MTQRTAQRFAAMAALAAVLFLGAATPAQAREVGSVGAWHRLQDLWTKAVSMLWDWIGPPAPESGSSGYLQKAGPSSDPDGSPSPAPPAGTSGDEGPSSDPDG
jgi:hypothetical protein